MIEYLYKIFWVSGKLTGGASPYLIGRIYGYIALARVGVNSAIRRKYDLHRENRTHLYKMTATVFRMSGMYFSLTEKLSHDM